MKDKANTPAKDYVNTIENMNALYQFFNKRYFGGELVTPVITVRQDMRGRAYGWFVPNKIWTAGEDYEGSVEINICSQWLDRPLEEIAGTMLHEMCHHYAYIERKKDTSRYGYYHNKLFKEIAENHGLTVEYVNNYHGWCNTQLTEESRKYLSEFVVKGKILYDLRLKHDQRIFGNCECEGNKAGQRKPSSTRKLICPKCGISVRATKDVNIICGNCKLKMVYDAD